MLFYFSSWTGIFLKRVNYSRLTFFFSFSDLDIISVSFGFHCYCWEVNCQTNYSSLKAIFLFFPLFTLNISLCLAFCSFINKSLSVDFLLIALLGNHWTSWLWKLVLFINSWKFTAIISLNISCTSFFCHLLEPI